MASITQTLLSRQQVAERLGVSLATVARLLTSGAPERTELVGSGASRSRRWTPISSDRQASNHSKGQAQ